MEGPKPGRRHPRLAAFLLGCIVGVGASIAVAVGVVPRLRVGMVGGEEQVGGIVRSKQVQPDRVLLAIPTDQGAVLAIFTEEVEGVRLLVEEGDSVTLAVDAYAPFLRNPEISHVVKAYHTTIGDPTDPAAATDSVVRPPDSTTTVPKRADTVTTTDL